MTNLQAKQNPIKDLEGRILNILPAIFWDKSKLSILEFLPRLGRVLSTSSFYGSLEKVKAHESEWIRALTYLQTEGFIQRDNDMSYLFTK